MKNFILKKIKVRILIIFLIIIFSIISFFKIKIDSKRWINADVTIKLPFEIDILSTGKSDFILIECENKFIVIDCGLYENNTLMGKVNLSTEASIYRIPKNTKTIYIKIPLLQKNIKTKEKTYLCLNGVGLNFTTNQEIIL